MEQQQLIVPLRCLKPETQPSQTRPTDKPHRLQGKNLIHSSSFFLKEVIYTLFYFACSIHPNTVRSISSGTAFIIICQQRIEIHATVHISSHAEFRLTNIPSRAEVISFITSIRVTNKFPLLFSMCIIGTSGNVALIVHVKK